MLKHFAELKQSKQPEMCAFKSVRNPWHRLRSMLWSLEIKGENDGNFQCKVMWPRSGRLLAEGSESYRILSLGSIKLVYKTDCSCRHPDTARNALARSSHHMSLCASNDVSASLIRWPAVGNGITSRRRHSHAKIIGENRACRAPLCISSVTITWFN